MSRKRVTKMLSNDIRIKQMWECAYNSNFIYAEWTDGSVHQVTLKGLKSLLKYYEQYLVDNNQANITVNSGKNMLDDRLPLFLTSLGIREIIFTQQEMKEALKWETN